MKSLLEGKSLWRHHIQEAKPGRSSLKRHHKYKHLIQLHLHSTNIITVEGMNLCFKHKRVIT